MRIILFCLIGSVLLSGCSSYSRTFDCGAAKGGSCLMMDEIDALIDSGEIEKYTKNEALKKSKKRKQEEVIISPKLPTIKVTNHFAGEDIEGYKKAQKASKLADKNNH